MPFFETGNTTNGRMVCAYLSQQTPPKNPMSLSPEASRRVRSPEPDAPLLFSRRVRYALTRHWEHHPDVAVTTDKLRIATGKLRHPIHEPGRWASNEQPPTPDDWPLTLLTEDEHADYLQAEQARQSAGSEAGKSMETGRRLRLADQPSH